MGPGVADPFIFDMLAFFSLVVYQIDVKDITIYICISFGVVVYTDIYIYIYIIYIYIYIYI